MSARRAAFTLLCIALASCGAQRGDSGQDGGDPQFGAGSGGVPVMHTAGSGGNTGMHPSTTGSGGAFAGSGGASAMRDAGAGGSVAVDAGHDAAPTHDAGPVLDARVPDDSSRCAAHDYLICEDFEDTAVDAIPGGWTKHGDPVAVAADAAHGGAHALKLGAIPTWERRIYHDASSLPASHWGRVYFKVQQPVPDAFVHSTMVAFGGDGPTRGASEFRVVDTVKQAADTPDVASRIQFLYNVQPQNSDEFGHGTSYDREFDDQWHCAEWFIDGNQQSYRFFFDGAELITLDNGPGNYDGTDIPTSFSEIRIGWINYQDSPPGFTAWLDDLAVDGERVGCF